MTDNLPTPAPEPRVSFSCTSPRTEPTRIEVRLDRRDGVAAAASDRRTLPAGQSVIYRK